MQRKALASVAGVFYSTSRKVSTSVNVSYRLLTTYFWDILRHTTARKVLVKNYFFLMDLAIIASISS